MERNFKNNSRNANSAERVISVIFNHLSENVSENLEVKKASLARMSKYCKGVINIYRKDDLKRASEDKKFTAKPVESYSFYGDTYNPAKIGSVAIYGDDALNRCLNLRLNGFLFGHKIRKATVEQGLRPFVDVQLAS